MKRFIDLGNQTGEIDYEAGEREFAFYDTVTGGFESIYHTHTWTSKESLKEDLKLANRLDELDRFLNLIPDDYFL